MITKKRENFFIIDNDFIELYAKHLGVFSVAVYSCLSKYADGKTGRCWPSMVTIAEKLKIHRRTVTKALNKLQEFNVIRITRGIDRKLRKRKNNVYQLVPKELWKDLPEEEYDDHNNNDDNLPFFVSDEKSHVAESTIDMASSLPDDGTEDASNKTNITKPIEEDLLCGLKPTKSYKGNTSSKAPSVPAVWNSDEAIFLLMRHYDKDYQIIGLYFANKEYSFGNRLACLKEIERNIKAAKRLTAYDINDIKKIMKYLDEQYFDTGWSLEAVSRYIEDYDILNWIDH